MSAKTWLVCLMLVAPVPGAWALTSATGTCALAWDAPAAPIPIQYYVYARRAGESYRYAIAAPSGGRPSASAQHQPGTLEQRLPCERLVLPGDGRWYLVVTTVAMDLSRESGPSEEIWLDVQQNQVVATGSSSAETPVPAPVLPPQIPPVVIIPHTVQDLPAPPPFAAMAPLPPPQPSGNAMDLTQSCLWQTCQPNPWPRTIPPGMGQGSPTLNGSTLW